MQTTTQQKPQPKPTRVCGIINNCMDRPKALTAYVETVALMKISHHQGDITDTPQLTIIEPAKFGHKL